MRGEAIESSPGHIRDVPRRRYLPRQSGLQRSSTLVDLNDPPSIRATRNLQRTRRLLATVGRFELDMSRLPLILMHRRSQNALSGFGSRMPRIKPARARWIDRSQQCVAQVVRFVASDNVFQLAAVDVPERQAPASRRRSPNCRRTTEKFAVADAAARHVAAPGGRRMWIAAHGRNWSRSTWSGAAAHALV